MRIVVQNIYFGLAGVYIMCHHSVFKIGSVASGLIPHHHSPPHSDSLVRCHHSPLKCCHDTRPDTPLSLCDGTAEEGPRYLLSHCRVALQGSHSFWSLESKDTLTVEAAQNMFSYCGLKGSYCECYTQQLYPCVILLPLCAHDCISMLIPWNLMLTGVGCEKLCPGW